MTRIDTIAQCIACAPSPAAMEDGGPALSVHLLDTVGAWIAGRASGEGVQLAQLKERDARLPAVFDGSVLDAIALATATARLTEVDDIHMASCTTPGAVAILSALALAADAASGPLNASDSGRLAASIHAGYEVMTCLGEALSGPEILHNGIWPTLLLAPVTTAAVASKLLGLDVERTANALAIALTASNGRPGGSASAGVAAGPGTSARWLLLGMAARTGCAAALSAARGFSGDRTLLDGSAPAALHGIAFAPQFMEGFFRQGSAVQRTSIKPYCIAKHNVAAVQALKQMLQEGIAHASLSRIRVKLPPAHARMVGHHDIETSRLSRITSCAYNIALAGVSPQHLLDIQRQEPVRSAGMSLLARKVEVVADEQLQSLTPQAYPATVELFIGEEKVACKTVVDAWGDPTLPFDMVAAQSKFRRLTEGVIDDQVAAQVETLCSGLFDSATAPQALWGVLTGIDKAHRQRPVSHIPSDAPTRL
ncbi:MmgE/PrpD family protein [Variovorax ginsengisoli]|uniref:2-methylcitrate dehydratase PrpD n=1 Tax=Variovorax ginsengisoli TaxID=363844 RepID=A0ABT9SC76_9BURK|nr:MmgE/PrpD family protein [Variovorax ginsengisoli]MDP9901934.1 2-methylcitrate dehydratase PrpD [Variovorax ginsengisoli]